MGMTMTQKILAAHAGLDSVVPGQLIEVELDLVLGNDITTPVAIKAFEEMGMKTVFDKSKIAIVPDHFAPNKDIQSAIQCQIIRKFSHEHDIEHYFEVGEMGIEHGLIPEKGLIMPGEVAIGADSHTCTYGAIGAFATGIGSTDMAAGMATGKAWFKVPSAIKIELIGKPQGWLSGKDIILYIIGKIGVDGARYQSLEFTGEGIQHLSIDDRFTMANMAIEAGAKNGIFPVDEVTIDYLQNYVKTEKSYPIYEADFDAIYDQIYTIELNTLTPIVAYPHLPENTHPITDCKNIKIDQVVIGSCTNGRLQDLREAAALFKDHHVAKGMRAIVFPVTQRVYLEALKEGLIEIFIEAGAVVSTPTCGPCLGGHMGILGEGERALSTTNRNFVGRMGHISSEVYLASPAVAAATAIMGYITDPNQIIERKLDR